MEFYKAFLKFLHHLYEGIQDLRNDADQNTIVEAQISPLEPKLH